MARVTCVFPPKAAHGSLSRCRKTRTVACASASPTLCGDCSVAAKSGSRMLASDGSPGDRAQKLRFLALGLRLSIHRLGFNEV
jgi:hypothetical protein